MYIFLSPHYDDAIGSAGGMILRLLNKSKQVKIITIMGGIPKSPDSNSKYVLTRRKENTAACSILGVPYLNADFLDAIYRTEIDYNKKDAIFNQKMIFEKKLCDDIYNYLNKLISLDDIIVAPSAFGNHIDHLIVRKASEKLKQKIIFYEDFFYDTLVSNDFVVKNYIAIELKQSEIKSKLYSFEKYESQIKELFKTKKEMISYFKHFHTKNKRAVERFSDISVFD